MARYCPDMFIRQADHLLRKTGNHYCVIYDRGLSYGAYKCIKSDSVEAAGYAPEHDVLYDTKDDHQL